MKLKIEVRGEVRYHGHRGRLEWQVGVWLGETRLWARVFPFEGNTQEGVEQEVAEEFARLLSSSLLAYHDLEGRVTVIEDWRRDA